MYIYTSMHAILNFDPVKNPESWPIESQAAVINLAISCAMISWTQVVGCILSYQKHVLEWHSELPSVNPCLVGLSMTSLNKENESYIETEASGWRYRNVSANSFNWVFHLAIPAFIRARSQSGFSQLALSMWEIPTRGALSQGGTLMKTKFRAPVSYSWSCKSKSRDNWL